MTITEAASIIALGAPVLCLDTCTILDIMRDPTRESMRPHDGKAALQLLAALENGPRLVCLIADQVQIELNLHKPRVQQEAEEALERFQKQILRIDSIIAAFGGNGSIELSHFVDHVRRSKEVIDRIVMLATPAPQATEVASRAFMRVNQAQAPAGRGKESMKDCGVIETYLDVMASLRAAGLNSKAVFVSSNTKDYAAAAGGSLKADLAGEFVRLNLEYAPNLAAAKHLLGL